MHAVLSGYITLIGKTFFFSVDNMIINVLTGAGVVGLHVDDIAQLIGVPERQAALQRLRYLAQSNLVEQKPGQIWKMKEPADINGNGKGEIQIS